MSKLKVFISYSHDSFEHKQWVLQLACRLIESGIDTIFDQWDLKLGGDLPSFMEKGISESSRVLLICTDRYTEKSNSGTGGVGYEKMIVTSEIFEKTDSIKYIPILRQGGSAKLPTFLKSKLYIDFSRDDDYETAIDELLREILDAPIIKKPELGTNPYKVSLNETNPTSPKPVTQLMTGISDVYHKAGTDGILRTEWISEQMAVSRLLFDHALDQAEELQYVECSNERDLLWVTAAGRAFMVTNGG